MNILVVTLNAWNTENSTGNTISNLFANLSESDKVANIYCRDERIKNSICHHYFKITEKDILYHLLSKEQCGQEMFYEDDSSSVDDSTLQQKNYYSFFRLHRFTLLLLLRELVWFIPVWKNSKLRNYILDFKPDIIYMHGHSNLYMHRLLDYCAEISGAHTVLFWGDDMYGRKSKLPFEYFYESLLRKRYRRSIGNASLLFGGSLKLCEEYSNLFHKTFHPFFKECKEIRIDEKRHLGKYITIVYAGNLLFGREMVLINLAKAIDKLNKRASKHQFILKIFSNTNPSDSSLTYLDDKKNSFFMGRKSYLEICKIMDQSDLALHIESFNRKNMLSTRLSFSTKIIDCMQSTAGILAIGPRGLASIDYIASNNLGYTITDVDEIESRMEYLSEHFGIIEEMNRHKIEFAKKFHTNTSAKVVEEIRRLL